ncbi:zinicin-like metallopeptidase [Humibacillus xanthopallidus]|uniref:Zinicin-like metallopeptidase n=2 Tax=Humibacillus xanthopallidus TaxID=412689 RepID=A0A543PS56_9MICO|nr:metallopeptidase family protein [Humibacillus xanthopallidus]TQN46894.1 zinicin-like metallopeptidase [Humibacillus xanthopallidus]
MSTSIPRPAPASRRRDRHGRGHRGPLAWPPVPTMRSRRDAFDDYVLDAAARLEATCGRAFPAVEFAVEDVPRGPAPWDHREVPLGRLFPATGARPARIVVYRRPVETRVSDRRDVAALVADIVTEQVAGLLGVSPEELDPGFGE